jgi:hypothetical protein
MTGCDSVIAQQIHAGLWRSGHHGLILRTFSRCSTESPKRPDILGPTMTMCSTIRRSFSDGLLVINILEESETGTKCSALKGEGVDRQPILLVQMICSHDISADSGHPVCILAKVEPLAIYSTQAKGYGIQTQNELQYESQCWEGKTPDQKAAYAAREELAGASGRTVSRSETSRGRRGVGR